MIRSMTGFGRGEATDGVRTVTVELRAVNHRYAEFNIRTPRRCAMPLRRRPFARRCARGFAGARRT